jgi:hypothetical protein
MSIGPSSINTNRPEMIAPGGVPPGYNQISGPLENLAGEGKVEPQAAFPETPESASLDSRSRPSPRISRRLSWRRHWAAQIRGGLPADGGHDGGALRSRHLARQRAGKAGGRGRLLARRPRGEGVRAIGAYGQLQPVAADRNSPGPKSTRVVNSQLVTVVAVFVTGPPMTVPAVPLE